jgi:hypothetical protein
MSLDAMWDPNPYDPNVLRSSPEIVMKYINENLKKTKVVLEIIVQF